MLNSSADQLCWPLSARCTLVQIREEIIVEVIYCKKILMTMRLRLTKLSLYYLLLESRTYLNLAWPIGENNLFIHILGYCL